MPLTQKVIMKRNILFISLWLLSQLAFGQQPQMELKVLQTSDVHGAIFPFDFINNKPLDASLAQVETYVKKIKANGAPYILLDNGDILQGQPESYVYNYVKTDVPHIISRVYNFMGYDAAEEGNHDIEAGHPVFDRVVKESNFPWLGANAVKEGTHDPYFKPYVIINRGGLKVAILGLITPGIPSWLPKDLWSGMEFDDMVESAQHWMKIIKSKEKPDVIIGLFHSGTDPAYGHVDSLSNKNENASVIVAMKVAGFDAIMIGHDHLATYKKVVGPTGDSVVVLNPGSGARYVSELTISAYRDSNGELVKHCSGKIVPMQGVPADPEFMKIFASDYKAVNDFVSQPIGTFAKSVSTKNAYFGPSAFIDYIHAIQIKNSGADISFAAPLSFVTEIKAGTIYVRDLFKLYKYENRLFTIWLTGKEIKNYLEYSYGDWFSTMNKIDDYLILFETDAKGNVVLDNRGRAKVKNRYYNFDSAYGIYYTVDVTKPTGERITILKMANGEPFDMNKRYNVALNSYRASGGGGHLTLGAKIPENELPSRVVKMGDTDFRMVILKTIEEQKDVIDPAAADFWRVIPSDYLKAGMEKDFPLLFGIKNDEE
jgi:5''-nucleotidase/2'',3''-cyclic phosphodiesterase and related esterases